MTVARVSFAESALNDLAGIQEWYAAEGVPEVGDRLVAEIFQRVEVLADQPDIGRIVPEFGEPFLRELIHPPFRIVYRRDPLHMRIVRVWRSERLLQLPASAKSQGLAD
ncbi:type II toxin-antitoxin system RelE/ParE family toxin [Thiorhodococcus mannitoliphagus]|uniref:Type II toxin-antitoxin system RelE/ParE family toxin n=1 Tax=Thiorhodococcus mannitoliphagus TaxID=329406 RepID=A0A6P1E4L2_9GAMM|nr:type II toxin-antitoxin system RelE/ParE family toxin [Thiorhodococcus mannitoliphagus]NEX23472.1 type II toxin-antitoxin system RelE/ParE family toxin [Thiorhodococcus mannitoliphagus]